MTGEELNTALQTAVARMNGGRMHDARALLEKAAAAAPEVAEVHRLLGLAYRATHDLARAERALAEAARLDPANLSTQATRAQVLVGMGRAAEAEEVYGAILARDPRQAEAATGLGGLLEAKARLDEALAVTTPAAEGSTDYRLLSQHAALLKASGHKAQSLAAYERAAALAPTSPVGDHNVGVGFADLNRYAEAEAALRRALQKGGRAPETWHVLAHALQGQDRLDEAEAAYREAIRSRPTYVEAHRDLAQLIWVRTEDVGAAAAALTASIAAAPQAAGLVIAHARMLSDAGDVLGSYEVLAEALSRRGDDPALLMAASQQALRASLSGRAVAPAERALALQPGDAFAETVLCEALLGVGDAARAAPMIERLRLATPHQQHVLALQATAWRMLGDPRFHDLYDYDAFVRPYHIDTPTGWGSLDAYLADLAEGLGALHTTRTHPVGQSLRHGSQTNQSLLHSEHPAVKAFTTAIDGPIRAHMAALGQGADPLRARNTGRYEIAGIWSVRLRPGGFHIDHVHPEGWLSSACYIALPKAVEGEGRQGWIRFGEPGIATRPHLEAQHHVKPEPGMLVLFPSYMWHGTVPYEGDDRRLTVAFDLVPG